MPCPSRSRLAARLAPLLLVLPVAFGAAGCHQSAHAADPARVRLHNDAPGWVAARVVHVGVARETTLARRTLGPGASDTLGPFEPPAAGSLQLVLEPATRDDFILRAPLPTGLTAYHVRRPFEMAKLGLVPQAVNPEWTFADGFMTEHQVQAIAQYEAIEPVQRRADADFEDLSGFEQP